MGLEMTDGLRELAASYALGVLDPGEVPSFQQLLDTHPELRTEVSSFQEVTADLASLGELTAPPPSLKSRLMAGLDAQTAATQKAAKRKIVRASETGWIKTPFPGVEVKRLFVDPVTGMITTLLRAAAGAVYPAHEHGGVEQVYVVDGDMIFADHTLDTGDFEIASGATQHSSSRPRKDAWR